jgi:hypothetical protein
LFEETLNIVFECFEKYKKNQSLLPIECLHNYQLIYNEDDDDERIQRDDNQLFSERLSIRYRNRQSPVRTALHRMLPRVNTSRTNQNDNKNNDIILPLVNIKNSKSSLAGIPPSNSSIGDTTPLNMPLVNTTPLSSTILRATPMSVPIFDRNSIASSISDAILLSPFTVDTTDETNQAIDSFKHNDDIELELLMTQKKSVKNSNPKHPLSSTSTITRPTAKINKPNPRRTFSSMDPFGLQRQKRINLTAVIVGNKRYTYRPGIVPPSTETIKAENKITRTQDYEQDQTEKQDNQSVITTSANLNVPELCFFN